MSEDIFEAKIEGLKNLADRLDYTGSFSNSLGRYVQSAGETVAGTARSFAPVDVGTLRSSINSQYREQEPGLYVASIGTNIKYATYMEYGTGTQHDHPNWPRNPHIVSPRALLGWATRQLRNSASGLTPESLAFIVARAITKRGGLKPRRFLRGAIERLGPGISAGIQRVIDRIIQQGGR